MSSEFAELIAGRRSIRAFTDAPVDRGAIEEMCRAARRAPSGANLQPGRFHVLTGGALKSLKHALGKAVEEGVPFDREYSYFPSAMSPELKSRQRAAGYALYEALGIARRDVEGRKRQFDRNYAFFGAPVGVVVTIDRDMGKGCFMDLGMALMSFLLSAEDQGFGATGIGALANYGTVVHRHLGLPETELVVCGIAIGVTDQSAPVNHFRTERLALEEFTSFSGFAEDP
ncbi:nitroreductase family protein [uncultured Roseovarius sp.]|uniref:nitroreductase family protein n=1 Tax=uncultured Roseovarius sp. TaxID=293344 RepID=UPI00260C3FD7|nr:nitroreductase family protein [uncultured Roseovarius sp.]